MGKIFSYSFFGEFAFPLSLLFVDCNPMLDLTMALPRLYARVLGCCITLPGLPWRVYNFLGPLQSSAAFTHCMNCQLTLIIYGFNTRSCPTGFSGIISL